jgi:uncharacterized membrane protein
VCQDAGGEVRGLVERIASGMVSIGGAGTFDGILLTGILALYLA